jgi:asparagine synthase (glutamine-hydrolysing)
VTVIAGVFSERAEPDRQAFARRCLDDQRRYGSTATHEASIDGATFIGSPWPGAHCVPAAFPPHLLLVADLRLENRDEVAERVGGSETDHSDAELLLAAWAKVGEQCLSWIAGDFALAVFDARKQRLTLARDPTGQAPLHYAQAGNEFAFASMPQGLSPFLKGFAVDRLALAASVCGLRDDDPRSHFEQIWRVLPGEIVQLSAAELRRRIYWTPTTAYDDPLRSADLVDEYRHVLDVAVANCLKGCSLPVATHLSSGYDSSAVTATAARLVSADQIIAFTSAPAGAAPVPPGLRRIADESGIAAATAAGLGVRHVIVREMPPMRDVIRRQSMLFQEPVIGVPNAAWLLQIRTSAAAAGATCLLSGESGNATLNAGGLYVLSDFVRQGRWLTWARQARLAAARPDTHVRGVLFNSFNPWMPSALTAALHRRRFGAGPADSVSFLRPEWRLRALEAAGPPPRHANQYAERVHMIRNGNPGMLRKGALAGEGIDERDPLADRRLVEFSLRIPPEQLYWNGVSRPLARAALTDRLPMAIIDLKVRGLQGADWAMRFSRTDARELLEEISINTTVRDLFDLGRMEQAIDRWPREDWNRQAILGEYRLSLIGALSGGMFALVHAEGADAGGGVP